MDTDGSYLEKNGEKEAVCRWHGSRDNPDGAHKCRSPLPLGNVSSESLSDSEPLSNAWREPFDQRSCHFNTEKCTRMTNCRQDALRFWKQYDFALFRFLKTPFFHYAPETRKINRALFHRETTRSLKSSPAMFEG